MPRLDNSSDEIILAFDLNFDPEDPGKTDTIDLCWWCALSFDPSFEIEHPPYENWDKQCKICHKPLTSKDN